MGFPRLDYWHGLSFPSPADLPNSGIEPGSPASTTLAGGCFTTESPGKLIYMYMCIYMKENPFKLERKSQIKKWITFIETQVLKEEIQMILKYMKMTQFSYSERNSH